MKWNEKKDNYFEQYVNSENGYFVYEKNGEEIYLKDIYNSNNEKIELDIPDNMTVLMYVNKDKVDEAIYFDLDDSYDYSVIYYGKFLFFPYLFIAFGLGVILALKDMKKDIITRKGVYLFFSFFIFTILALSYMQINKILTYRELKEQGNIVTATIYSELFTGDKSNKTRHTISAYYYVDGNKYIYVRDFSEEIDLNKEIGKTIELYYDEADPSRVIEKDKVINQELIILIIVFTVLLIWMWNERLKFEKRNFKNNEEREI